ncbi:MAG: hypothetical protein Kow00124_02800 [Anaerolineae bacterium]
MTAAAPTLAAAADRFISHTGQIHSPQLATSYSQALALFHQYLHNAHLARPERDPVSTLTAEWFHGYLSFLQANRSVETEHLYSRGLLAFYRHCTAEYHLDLDLEALDGYLEETRRPKQHHTPLLPLQAIEAILHCAASTPPPPRDEENLREYLRFLRDRAFLLILGGTGLRVSEMCNLRRRSFDDEQRLLALNDNLHLPLNQGTTAHLKRYLAERQPLDSQQAIPPADLPLFARHDKRAGKRVLPISRWTGANIVDEWARRALDAETRQALEQAGQSISPHTFRHYFVFTTLTRTEDIETTRRMARHVDRATTRRYLQGIKGHHSDQDQP